MRGVVPAEYYRGPYRGRAIDLGGLMSQPAADLDAVVFTDRNGTRVSLGDLFGEPVAVRYEDLIP